MFQRLIAGAAVMSVVLLTGGAALAGGWAITEFDEPLPEFIAGEEYVIGFTVLQHGVTPRWTESVHLTFKSPDGGPTMKFPAEPTGVEGHFEAVVVVPEAGVWQLEVDQGFLIDFPLHLEPYVVGPIEVASPDPQAATPAPAANPLATEPLTAARSGLSGGFGLALAGVSFLVGGLVVWMGSGPGTSRWRKVYKKTQPSPEAAWTTEN